MGKLIIFSAPSGSGKTTIVRELLQRFPRLEFSVSATSRAPRGTERNGVDYYLPLARRIPPGGRRRAFRRMGGGLCRHLLRHAAQRTRPHLGERAYHSVRRRRAEGLNLKRIFGADACSVFIMPPSIEELERERRTPGTDSPETIECRSPNGFEPKSGVRP